MAVADGSRQRWRQQTKGGEVGGSMGNGTGGILWINVWHDERNLLASVGKEGTRRGWKREMDEGEHNSVRWRQPISAIQHFFSA